jgi:transcriptional regulator with XRE-family HTH domain
MIQVKSLREKQNLRQEDLAAMMNIDRSTVAMWETGKSLPRADKLPQLAAILGCTIDELLCVGDEK